MAQRRMISNKIIDTGRFLEMPMSSQLLYFHMAMRADDDGFVDNPRIIQRMIGCNDDDLKILIAKSYVIPFESGVCVITHWRIHNYIQSDRYTPTMYKDEKRMLEQDENNAYLKITQRTQLDSSAGVQRTQIASDMDKKCIQNGSELAPQVRLGKDRLGKVTEENKKNACACVREENGTSVAEAEAEIESALHVMNDPDSKTPLPVAAYCVKNGIRLSATANEEIRDFYEQGMPDDLMDYAVDVAIDRNALSWKFTKTVIDRWLMSDIRDLASAKRAQAEFKARKDTLSPRARASPEPSTACKFQKMEDYVDV